MVVGLVCGAGNGEKGVIEGRGPGAPDFRLPVFQDTNLHSSAQLIAPEVRREVLCLPPIDLDQEAAYRIVAPGRGKSAGGGGERVDEYVVKHAAGCGEEGAVEACRVRGGGDRGCS